MKTYEEVFQNVMAATNAHRRKIKKIQSTVSASIICVVCIGGASIYVRLEKPESVPPGQETITETTTDCSNMQIVQETDRIKNTETGTESEEIPGETQENFQELSQESTEETESGNSQESDLSADTSIYITTDIAESGTHPTMQIYQTETKAETKIEVIETIEIIETLASGTESAVTPVQSEESESYPENTDILLPTEILETSEILETPEILETSAALETTTSEEQTCESTESESSEETSESETTTTIPEMSEESEEFEIFSDFPTEQTRTEMIVS